MASPSKKTSTYHSSRSAAVAQEPMVAYTATVALHGAAQRSVALMGLSGSKAFKEIRNDADFIECIRLGVPKVALDNIMEMAGFSVGEISSIIRTSDRTLRRYTPSTKLNPEQSERVIEVAKLYSRGEEVFGNLDTFKIWMNSSVLALGNKSPKEYLDTSLGIDMLMDELGRIEHGVFA